jgi:mannitol-specific phosphotransferase system IIBC component
MALFGMIVCLAAIIAIIIFAGLKIKSKWLAIVAAVILSCVVMMPFSCCAGKWYKKHREQVKIEKAAEKKAAEQAEKAQNKAEQLPDKNNL